MRVAIIDLGTNSVRFDVHQISSSKTVKTLHREKLMVRLGQGVFTHGKLNPEAVRRTLQAFTSFKNTAEDLGVERFVAFGTSALREASDGQKLLKLIQAKTGIEIRVISGKEEASLISLGVLSNEKLPKGRFGLIDIGGGSTEISLCRGKKVLAGDSFALGTARLQQVFLRGSPPRAKTNSKEDPVKLLRKYIRTTILTKTLSESWPKIDKLIGSSGTVRAIAKLAKKKGNGKSIDRSDLKKVVKAMCTMNTEELLSMPGMEAKRVDMILAGAILLEECMNVLNVKKIVSTEFSLRDGVLEEQIELAKAKSSTKLELHIDDLKAKAAKIHPNPSHFIHVAETCETLFDALKPIHKLKPSWRALLLAASYLHDMGELISPTNHEEHSYYFAKNIDFAPLDKWESEFIARLCLYHRVGKPELEQFVKGNKERKDAFMKLLAILRVADALDRGHKSLVKATSVKYTKNTVEIRVSSKTPPDLELLRVEQKKQLFEDVFKKTLILKFSKSR